VTEKTFENNFSYVIIYVMRINDHEHKDLLKIGQTTISSNKDAIYFTDDCNDLNDAATKRIDEYTKTAGISYELLYTTIAISNKEGKTVYFTDHDVHNVLKRSGINIVSLNKAKEWFKCDLSTAKNAINAARQGKTAISENEKTINKSPIEFRPEQIKAIDFTINRFSKSGRTAVLWNAKMRFGKTLTALEVVKRMKYKKTIIFTHRPVVKDSWYDDFNKIFYDSPNYEYGAKKEGKTLQELQNNAKNKGTSFVYFISIQDLRGSDIVGGLYNKNEEVFQEEWNLAIIDEAHEGTQTNLAKEIIPWFTESTSGTKSIYLTGTAFNLIETSDSQFNTDNTYVWDYIDEQRAKYDWDRNNFGEHNPYSNLPKLNIRTFDLGMIFKGEKYSDIVDKAFNFNEFFKVDNHSFVYEKEVQHFLNILVKGDSYPYSTKEYQEYFKHTLWVVPGVKAAKVLSKLLREHSVFGSGDFEIVNVAGDGDDEIPFKNALADVKNAIKRSNRTITITCGRLTTGVTVPEWTAVFMLAGSNSTSITSYMQTIFRVQSPANIDGMMKTDCYVFDFAPDRTLKILAGAISNHGNHDKNKLNNPLSEFLNFCPILAYDGTTMRRYNVDDMLKQLKKADIDRVVRNGFDDNRLFVIKDLLNIDNLQYDKFSKLKGILKASKCIVKSDIIINSQGFDEEEYELNRTSYKNKKTKTLEEKEAQKKKNDALSILRAIAVRIPLILYGINIDNDSEIDINNFSELVDDISWEEFMPKGVTKEIFNDFEKYFDKEIFKYAGINIRNRVKDADNLPPIERVQSIANLFATFKNPDKETVLTPWRVVNLHLGETIGGYVYYSDDKYNNSIFIDDSNGARYVEKKTYTKDIYYKETKVLEINSKTGLYPLFIASSLFLNEKNRGTKTSNDEIWKYILKNNIYVICKTKMAEEITNRTLRGFKEYDTNIRVINDIYNRIKNDRENLIKQIKTPWYWSIRGGEVMKFDAVIGNPPYSQNNVNLYPYFAITAVKLTEKVVSIICPDALEGNNELKGKIIQIDKQADAFPGIGIKVSTFLLSNNYNSPDVIRNGKVSHIETKSEKQQRLRDLWKSTETKGSVMVSMKELARMCPTAPKNFLRAAEGSKYRYFLENDTNIDQKQLMLLSSLADSVNKTLYVDTWENIKVTDNGLDRYYFPIDMKRFNDRQLNNIVLWLTKYHPLCQQELLRRINNAWPIPNLDDPDFGTPKWETKILLDLGYTSLKEARKGVKS